MIFEKRSIVRAPREFVFKWHESAHALPRLIPPWDEAKVIQHPGHLRNGSKVVVQMKLGPMTQDWVAVHKDYEFGKEFCDIQESGPFAKWEHHHHFKDAPQGCEIRDVIEYKLPWGILGPVLADGFTRRKLDRFFEFRHQRVQNELETLHKYGNEKLKILVSGGSGLVGQELMGFLRAAGHQVSQLVRRKPTNDSEIAWDPSKPLSGSKVSGFDIIVHLGGESIASGRWSEAIKTRIENSRVGSTQVLSKAIREADQKPKAFICASAIGYYGDRGNQILSESASVGSGFLAEVCKKWEEAAQESNVRSLQLRIGLVLSSKGGALKKMLTPFRLGIGGALGTGLQYMSWISIDDLVYAIYHLMHDSKISGPVNLVSPEPLMNREFSKTLARVLGRTMGPAVPPSAIRLVAGEMADALLLSSCRVEPKVLLDSKFKFRHENLESALRFILGEFK